MQVRLLGTAAGGGFPQWNCNCSNCRLARHNPAIGRPRTQSCVALSADGRRWFLLNASPDVRIQIESFRSLWPASKSLRGTPIAGVLLSSAELDHTLGLLNLRENGPLFVHASGAVRRSLCEGMKLDAVFSSFGSIEWNTPPESLAPLRYPDGTESGIRFLAFSVPGKVPRYRQSVGASMGDAVGYRFVDDATGGTLVFVPDLAAFDDRTVAETSVSNLLLLDGTFFTEDEMQRTGTGSATASEMGHLAVGGPQGSLAKIAANSRVSRVYVHINNTNPMILENSPERAAVEETGVRVGVDGMQFSL